MKEFIDDALLKAVDEALCKEEMHGLAAVIWFEIPCRCCGYKRKVKVQRWVGRPSWNQDCTVCVLESKACAYDTRAKNLRAKADKILKNRKHKKKS